MNCWRCGNELGTADVGSMCNRCASEQAAQFCPTSNVYDARTHAFIDGFIISKESIFRWLRKEIDGLHFELKDEL